MKRIWCLGLAVALAAGLSFTTATTAAAQVCLGNCANGVVGVDGVVTVPPTAGPYNWISTFGGVVNTGLGLGPETNGSLFTSSSFVGSNGGSLNFYINYVTSDGSGFVDYAWAKLINTDLNTSVLLFTAQTSQSPQIPGQVMPPEFATLLPPESFVIGGGPAWSPLGGSSGACFATGCGYSDWVSVSFTMVANANYVIELGVTNWADTAFDSGLAFTDATVVPEPSGMLLMLTGLLGLGVRFRAKRRGRVG